MASLMPRCSCGRFVSTSKGPIGWYKHGEYGEDEGWICRTCLPNWTPRDGRGRGPEAGYCGIIHHFGQSAPLSPPAALAAKEEQR